jgi:S-adenosylmethionine hydrolase
VAPRRVTLTTDFGTRDPYVAAMKGVISSICPEAAILDLTHEISPQDILEGALLLAGSAPYFPAGTVHVAVVDPGVGGERRAVAVRAAGQTFVCPDNGLLTLVLRILPREEARVVVEPRFMLETVSATFHGRDVFAPVAAYLAGGVALEEMGPSAGDLVLLDIPEPVRTGGDSIHGIVLHVDRFGNLITNIPRGLVESTGIEKAAVSAGNAKSLPLRRTYSEGAFGEVVALFSSSNHLEIAANGVSAAGHLGMGPGDPVEVTFRK